MENLYFPLFLVILAVAVMWLFSRATSRRRNRISRTPKTPAGRSLDADRLERNSERRGPAAPRVLASATPNVPKARDPWQTRRERAAQETFGQSETQRGVYHAGYIGPYEGSSRGTYGGYGVKDQNISRAEHLSIDEYLTKQEKEKAAREAARKAEKEAGLTMTAVKYEPADKSAAKENQEAKKQAGFKP